MLRCVLLKRVTRQSQTLCHTLLSCRRNSGGKLYQARSLSFLPIVSSLDTAKEKLPQKNELDKPRIIHTPDDTCVSSPEDSEPYGNVSTETPHGEDYAKLQGQSPIKHE